MSEEAARKRLSRGLEKLRGFMLAPPPARGAAAGRRVPSRSRHRRWRRPSRPKVPQARPARCARTWLSKPRARHLPARRRGARNRQRRRRDRSCAGPRGPCAGDAAARYDVPPRRVAAGADGNLAGRTGSLHAPVGRRERRRHWPAGSRLRDQPGRENECANPGCLDLSAGRKFLVRRRRPADRAAGPAIARSHRAHRGPAAVHPWRARGEPGNGPASAGRRPVARGRERGIPDGDDTVLVACLVCFYEPAPDRASSRSPSASAIGKRWERAMLPLRPRASTCLASGR